MEHYQNRQFEWFSALDHIWIKEIPQLVEQLTSTSGCVSSDANQQEVDLNFNNWCLIRRDLINTSSNQPQRDFINSTCHSLIRSSFCLQLLRDLMFQTRTCMYIKTAVRMVIVWSRAIPVTVLCMNNGTR